MGSATPDDYKRVEISGGHAVLKRNIAAEVEAALQSGTLHAVAGRSWNATRFTGRTTALGVQLPSSGTAVVIRRSAHGGLLAPVTGQLFRGSGRAPVELANSIELRRRGVRTPELLGYIVYHRWLGLSNIDVITSWVAGGATLPDLASGGTLRPEAVTSSVRSLLESLSAARARHPDLNARNILISTGAGGATEAWVLDVDRVLLDAGTPAAVESANASRLARSLRKFGAHAQGHALQPLLHALEPQHA